jgi:hypothetical protein
MSDTQLFARFNFYFRYKIRKAKLRPYFFTVILKDNQPFLSNFVAEKEPRNGVRVGKVEAQSALHGDDRSRS